MMAHRYGEEVQAQQSSAGSGEVLEGFWWRGAWYHVAETLATWRLRDRWWEEATQVEAASAMATERAYYRVRCVDPEGEQIFDLYHDMASDIWMLDRAHD